MGAFDLPRILIVEDEALLGLMMAEWLQELGHEPLGPATSEDSALALVERGEAEAAFVDLQLAKGDGYAVARALRARGVPFALMSGYGRGDLSEEFRASPLLGKPFDFESVKALVGEWSKAS